MSWIILFIAGLLEVVWAIGLKYTHGFTRLTPSVITVTAMIVSIVCYPGRCARCLWERLMPSGRVLAPWGPPSPAFCCW
jgi:quaternary ammonium compound-resistance protein SugE